jgi:drug/metabolite transporter (DMT)-like permease
LQVVELNGLIAGPINPVLGLSAGGHLPGISETTITDAIGFLGYGVGLALFVLALRHLGTARTGADFSITLFSGTLAAVVFLHEPVTIQLATAGIMMVIGVCLHITEDLAHNHVHEAAGCAGPFRAHARRGWR